MYYVGLQRAVLNLLSQRNSERYIGVHFLPREVLQSLLRFNIAQRQFISSSYCAGIRYSKSFIFEWTEESVQFY